MDKTPLPPKGNKSIVSMPGVNEKFSSSSFLVRLTVVGTIGPSLRTPNEKVLKRVGR